MVPFGPKRYGNIALSKDTDKPGAVLYGSVHKKNNYRKSWEDALKAGVLRRDS
jgi:hypothetical protein